MLIRLMLPDTLNYYCNIDDNLKRIAKGVYTKNQLRYGLHCIKYGVMKDKSEITVYILPARNGYRKSGYSGVDIIFEKTGEDRWQITEECRRVVFVDENRINRVGYLEEILKNLEIGMIVTEKTRFNLLRLKDLLE